MNSYDNLVYAIRHQHQYSEEQITGKNGLGRLGDPWNVHHELSWCAEDLMIHSLIVHECCNIEAMLERRVMDMPHAQDQMDEAWEAEAIACRKLILTECLKTILRSVGEGNSTSPMHRLADQLKPVAAKKIMEDIARVSSYDIDTAAGLIIDDQVRRELEQDARCASTPDKIVMRWSEDLGVWAGDMISLTNKTLNSRPFNKGLSSSRILARAWQSEVATSSKRDIRLTIKEREVEGAKS